MQLLQEIENGYWKPGSCLPSEKALAEEHRVSIGTVRNAILNLVNGGYLYRVQGSGTFVAGTHLRRDSLHYYRMLETFDSIEAQIQIKFLNIKEIKGIDTVNPYLKIRKNQSIFQLERLLLSDKKEAIYTVSYFPKIMFPGLDQILPQRFERVPIFSLLETGYGKPTIFNKELMAGVGANKTAAKNLQVQEGFPVLLIEMLAYTYKEQPYEYRLSYCLSGKKKIFRQW